MPEQTNQVRLDLRVLGLTLRLAGEDPALLATIAGALGEAEYPFPAQKTVELAVHATDQGFRIRGPDGAQHRAANLSLCIQDVVNLVWSHMAAFYGHCPVITAASFAWGEMAVLVVGRPESGKSTLALALAARGLEVMGDSYLFFDAPDVLAVPMRFHVWRGVVRLLAGMKGQADSPTLQMDTEIFETVNLDPRDLGSPWRIRPLRPGAVIALEPNFFGVSRLRPRRPAEVMARIEAGVSPPRGAAPRTWAPQLMRTLGGLTAASLEFGRLDQAADEILAFLAARHPVDDQSAV